LAVTKLILSINVNNSSGKIAFGILKGCKTKDYEENASQGEAQEEV
jgi:hypothetical protein